MATAQFYKLDDGKSRPTHCFPVRSFFQQGRDGAGHWLVAHKNAVEQKYRRLQSRKPAGSLTQKLSAVSYAASTQLCGKADARDKALDGPLLMRLHCVDKPSDLCSVDISGQKLHSVKEKDLEEFDSVAYINASDNCLPLEAFRRFPVLTELELSMNSLRGLCVEAGDFPHLKVLDVSYNNLSSDALVHLALLPCLKVLHLTGNKLQSLPEDLAASYHGSTRTLLAQDSFFHTLEVLMLDDNCLSSPGVFVCLANLKRLRHLNLQGNCIVGVPHLQQTGGDAEQPGIRGEKRSEELTKVITHVLSLEIKAPPKEPVDKTGWYYWTRRKPVMQNLLGGFTLGIHLPFPKLQHLNLAHNKICEEEAVLAVALFPELRELVIHSNPLTTQRSGDPPLLTALLQERLGIQIRRKKTEITKPHIVLQVNPNRKIETTIPKVPKLPLCLEAPAGSPRAHGSMKRQGENLERSAPEDTELPGGPHTPVMLNKGVQSPAQEDDQDNETFFMTQLNDSRQTAWSAKSEEKRSTEERTVPEKFRGYEILLDAQPDPDMFQPVGEEEFKKA
ncbi:X-ray radiation resistance-associated protein 1-like isoform X1 [Arapaima gigas]